MTDSSPTRVCFVCTGNICRSPMADVVFAHLAAEAGLADRFVVSSAGTGDWHVGDPADPRAVAALARRGYDGTAHRARQFDPAWFDDLDLVVALDRGHERALRRAARTDADRDKVRLLLSFDPDRVEEDVPDPYYDDDRAFEDALTMVEDASRALLARLR
ncbi:low molecular weight protein-tyrosine-phosphatase [Microbacterium sp. gxy059]|uniref:low molecular weight protein-tyrosine-phosphatase n=1 Tax=Microbacterium sp. gxy059 TaxID=2957199 RepID=UPI003D967551